MKVFLNGKSVDLPAGLTVAGLVTEKKLNPDTIIIEYNRQLLKKENWPEVVLKENDRLEILKFVGGG